jgi:hypothetical protein
MFLNYNNFINKLKNRVFINKFYKSKNLQSLDIEKIPFFFDFNNNLLKIKKELLNINYLKKK